jgi:hypothetical protein
MEGSPIHRAAEFYRRGVICAAVAWNAALDSLSAETASRELCELSADDQTTLREAFLPHYLDHCTDERVRMAVGRWLGEGR